MLEKLRFNPCPGHQNSATAIQRIAIGLALAISASAAQSSAQSPDMQFIPFADFLANVRAANFNDLVPGKTDSQMTSGTEASSTGTSKVRSEAAFQEMRQAILDRYLEVEVTHSFMVANQLYDCVPVAQQLAVRKYHLEKIATPPPLLNSASQQNQELVESEGGTLRAPTRGDFDAFGNATHCGANTIPLLRPSLETMSHFATLKDFYTKTPSARQSALTKAAATTSPNTASVPSAQTPVSYKGAYMSQTVDNLGASAAIDIVTPVVNTAATQVMSTSQLWIEGGTGDSLQTVEAGWSVDPNMFGDDRNHFFIYSTADGYKTGCFNNLCSNFIQVDSSALLGEELPPSSNPDAANVIAVTFQLVDNNWWLVAGNTAVGYYPKEAFNGGQLTRHAQSITFGTEGAGTTSWPQAGNACLATDSGCSAAFLANLVFFNMSGTPVVDNLSPIAASPACYNTDGPFPDHELQGYFFVGGPGGTNCH